MDPPGGRRGVLAPHGEGAVRAGGSFGVLIGLHADQDAWRVVWSDLHRYHRLSLNWAWEHLTCEQLWALIEGLPPESWWRRRAGTSSPLEENVATLLDFVVYAVLTRYTKDTFNPEKWPQHAELADLAKRATNPPAPLPPVVPVAIRPRDWASLTAALTVLPEPPVEEVEGHEAHVRLQSLLNAQT